MPKPTHIAETALYVEDLERSVPFYAGLFECPTHRRDERFCALRISVDQVLLLFRRGHSDHAVQLSDGAFIPAHDGSGRLHVCFGIRPDQLPAWETRLQQLNVPIESRVLWSRGATSLYFRDPDHHLVELATPGLWE